MIRLSIIVPFYNVEKYIEQCVRSLYDQDISTDEYEVICIDDCSPDGSCAIVKRLQDEYPSLQLICHTKNKKQGGARNTGVRCAKGEYIWFVDSDDYVKSNVLDCLLCEAENDNVDILHFGHYVIEGKEQREYKYSNVLYNCGIDYVVSIRAEWSKHLPQMWGMFIRRSLLLENNLFFVEGVKYEDTDLSLRMFAVAQMVKQCDIIPYCYRVVNNSTTHQQNTPQKMIYQILLMFRSYNLLKYISHSEYRTLIFSYVYNELYSLGKQILQLSSRDRKIYRSLMLLVPLFPLRKVTSMRNWCRIKFAI